MLYIQVRLLPRQGDGQVHWLAGDTSFTPSSATDPLKNPSQGTLRTFLYPKFRLWPKSVSQAMERDSCLLRDSADAKMGGGGINHPLEEPLF